MKLKHIAYILTIFLSVSIVSCNGDDTSYTETAGSKNAMIYSFSLKGKMTNAIDSATYPVLEKTLFAIDQRNELIYNPDSLPYQTKLTKFLPTISFASNTASTLEIVYPDSTVTWKAEDSIDFAQSPIEFKVTSPGGETKWYDIKLNVHQIDPDTIEWRNETAWNIPKSGAIGQRILTNGSNVYVFTQLSSGVRVYMSNRNTVSWSAGTLTSLPANIRLESFVIFNNAFYVVNQTGNAYKSTDAINWTMTGNTAYIYNILGVLPEETAAKDSVLVVTKNGSNYYWGKTNDLKNVVQVDAIKGYYPNIIPSDFIATGFTSGTSYNRSTLSKNLLYVSGGVTFGNRQVADTWGISSGKNNVMEAAVAKYDNKNDLFDISDDFKTFFYDGSLYGLTNDSLYISDWGFDWGKAPQKQALYPQMKTVKDMSVMVDEANYIWIVGDMTGSSVYNVWRGRLNRLRK